MRPEGGARRRVASTVASVESVRALTPRMIRVRLADASLRDVGAVPGQTIKLHVPDPSTGSPASRDYTVRDYRDSSADQGDPAAVPRLDIDFVLHGAGPAVDWARTAAPGDTVEFVGPSGRWRPDVTADWHLFAGDETALPAIQAYAGMLPPDADVRLYVEVPDATEQQPIPGPARPVHWLHRDGAAPGTSTVLEEALRTAELPPGRGRIWMAGHTPTVRRIRAHLLDERGVDRAALYVKGFWDRAPR